jgi:hypothetical protein
MILATFRIGFSILSMGRLGAKYVKSPKVAWGLDIATAVGTVGTVAVSSLMAAGVL